MSNKPETTLKDINQTLWNIFFLYFVWCSVWQFALWVAKL